MHFFVGIIFVFHIIKESERERDGGREGVVSRDVRAGSDTRDGKGDEDDENDDDEGWWFYERGGGGRRRVDLY